MTLAPYDLLRKHKCKLKKSIVEKLKAANGSDIIINREAPIPLHIVGCKVETVALTSKDLTETILGFDWLQKHNCEWDFVQNRARFSNEEWIDLVG